MSAGGICYYCGKNPFDCTCSNGPTVVTKTVSEMAHVVLDLKEGGEFNVLGFNDPKVIEWTDKYNRIISITVKQNRGPVYQTVELDPRNIEKEGDK